MTADDYGMDGPLVIGEFPGEAYMLLHTDDPLPLGMTTPELVSRLVIFNQGLIFKRDPQFSMSTCMSMDSTEAGFGSSGVITLKRKMMISCLDCFS